MVKNPSADTGAVDSIPGPGKSDMLCKSIHFVANGVISFFLMTEYFSIVYMYHICFIHSSVDGHLGCFHVLATVNSATMNTEVHVSFGAMFFSTFLSRSGIAGSYGSSVVHF